ncbi:hypothetical protein GmHk_07G020388 [Glycine max]|nr:hypothetical protein GmHk_07G020388 [Glycine max]
MALLVDTLMTYDEDELVSVLSHWVCPNVNKDTEITRDRDSTILFLKGRNSKNWLEVISVSIEALAQSIDDDFLSAREIPSWSSLLCGNRSRKKKKQQHCYYYFPPFPFYAASVSLWPYDSGTSRTRSSLQSSQTGATAKLFVEFVQLRVFLCLVYTIPQGLVTALALDSTLCYVAAETAHYCYGTLCYLSLPLLNYLHHRTHGKTKQNG